ncbi:hypothetical protein [Kribbella sp. CA-294648]|uniref:hypothetical protein n=1 Tax=Kribbella sp. CA-294648 TaxID=3239948 RepID=UPI003D93B626
MNNLLTPPPEHDLRSTTRERQREELIAIVAHESHQGTPRRRLVPLAAAAAVVAVVAGLAVGVPALRGDGSEPAVSGSTGSDLARSAPAQALDALATKLTWSACLMGVRENPRLREPILPYTGGKAFEYKTDTAPGTPKRWFFTVSGSYGSSLVCALDAQGKVVERWSITGPTGRGLFLFAPAEVRGGSSGLYTAPVARITLQKPGGPLVEARLRDGFWFTSLADAKAATVRAYDKAGKLIYDSVEQRPSPDDCYADPYGTKVLKTGKTPNPNPASCHRTLVWSNQPR